MANSRRVKFVGIDTEGVTIEETGEHVSIMLVSSLKTRDGRPSCIVNEDGYSTMEAFRFLIDTKEAAGKGAVLVGFAFGYDTNMILRDVSEPHLVELQKLNKTTWRRFRIEYLPHKWLRVHDMVRGRRVTVYDVFGFFQVKFTKALQKWNVPAPEMIDHMKRKRSEFTAELLDEILVYCAQECECLVVLMERLCASLDSVGLTPSQWHGPGAIANKLLGRHEIHTAIQPDDVYGELQDGIMRAYYGGRTELFQQGEFDVLYGYDLRSAYPAACLTLPNLTGARFVRDDSHEPRSDVVSLHKVSWEVNPDAYIMPFPFRFKRMVHYPAVGSGWYWSCEVEVAREIHGEAIRVEESYVLRGPLLDERPLAFVSDIYNERAALKRDGHFGHQSLKLAINSLYGKLAQGVGYDGRDPRFRTYVWAGWITAYTRARMARLATPHVVAIATDGIFFTRDPGYECGDGLGELEASVMRRAFIAQPGVYEGETEDGDVKKSRGVYFKEVDYDDLRAGYREHGPYYVSSKPSDRFIGLGTAVTRRKFKGTWRRWEKRDRKLSLYPSRKFIVDADARPLRHRPPVQVAPGLSEPYIPKRAGLDAPGMEDFVQALEQPLKE